MRTRRSPRNQERLWKELGGEKNTPVFTSSPTLREDTIPSLPPIPADDDERGLISLAGELHRAGYAGEQITSMCLEAALAMAVCFGSQETIDHFKSRLSQRG